MRISVAELYEVALIEVVRYFEKSFISSRVPELGIFAYILYPTFFIRLLDLQLCHFFAQKQSFWFHYLYFLVFDLSC